MSSSNPLVAVGISAVVLLGTASASPAQTESLTNADSTGQKPGDVAETTASQPQQKQATESARPLEESVSSTRLELVERIQAIQVERSDERSTVAVASETNSAIKSDRAIAVPSIKIFVNASQPEAAGSIVAQVTSEDELEESDDTPASDETVPPDETAPEPGAEDSENNEDSEEPTLPRIDPSNMINPQPPAEPDESLDDVPDETESESPIDPSAPTDSPDPSDSLEDPAPLLDTESEETPPELETPAPTTPDVAEPELEGTDDADTVDPTVPSDLDEDQPPSDQLDEELDEEDEEPEDLDPEELPDEEADEIEAIEDDEVIQSGDPDASAPEYLDPDPNPLSFPTTPEEVELVGTQPLTLEQAIELAVRNNAELQASRLELQRQQAALREAEANNYPDVNADVTLDYQSSESAVEVPEDAANPLGETDLETPTSRALVLGGGLTVQYPIYTSGRRAALIEAAERQVRFQELQVESDTEELIFQITSAYYDLQEADEEVQIFRASLEEAERSLRDAEALERAGVGTRFDVLQAQVDVANALQNLRNQESDQEIARRQLAERLNLNQTVTLAAADPVEIAGVWELDLEETIVAAFRNRAELEQQLVQREIAQQNRRSALAQLGPQVNASTSYNLSNSLANDASPAAEDAGFLSDFRAQLGVSMVLFDGGEARAQARQAEANIEIAEVNFANQRDQIRFDVEQAYSQLNSNFENIQTTALAVQQAIEALRLARLRFQAGVGTQTDVLQAQTALTQARFNNLQAILNYNRALAALQRQVSNLPDGALNETP